MVNGQWSMVNGQWSMVNGQWSVIESWLFIACNYLPAAFIHGESASWNLCQSEKSVEAGLRDVPAGNDGPGARIFFPRSTGLPRDQQRDCFISEHLFRP
jgi:hypothetical protein